MIKQFILIVLFSFAAIIFRTQLHHALGSLIYVHNYIAQALHMVFSDDNAGRLIQDIISLLLIPVLAGLIVAMMFLLFKREAMAHSMAVIWVVWLVLLVTMITNGVSMNEKRTQSASRSSYYVPLS